MLGMGWAAFGGLGLVAGWGTNSLSGGQLDEVTLGPALDKIRLVLFWTFLLVLIGALGQYSVDLFCVSVGDVVMTGQ